MVVVDDVEVFVVVGWRVCCCCCCCWWLLVGGLGRGLSVVGEKDPPSARGSGKRACGRLGCLGGGGKESALVTVKREWGSGLLSGVEGSSWLMRKASTSSGLISIVAMPVLDALFFA